MVYGYSRKQQANSKIEALRQLIDDAENSGDLLGWDANKFLERMKLKEQ